MNSPQSRIAVAFLTSLAVFLICLGSASAATCESKNDPQFQVSFERRDYFSVDITSGEHFVWTAKATAPTGLFIGASQTITSAAPRSLLFADSDTWQIRVVRKPTEGEAAPPPYECTIVISDSWKSAPEPITLAGTLDSAKRVFVPAAELTSKFSAHPGVGNRFHVTSPDQCKGGSSVTWTPGRSLVLGNADDGPYRVSVLTSNGQECIAIADVVQDDRELTVEVGDITMKLPLLQARREGFVDVIVDESYFSVKEDKCLVVIRDEVARECKSLPSDGESFAVRIVRNRYELRGDLDPRACPEKPHKGEHPVNYSKEMLACHYSRTDAGDYQLRTPSAVVLGDLGLKASPLSAPKWRLTPQKTAGKTLDEATATKWNYNLTSASTSIFVVPGRPLDDSVWCVKKVAGQGAKAPGTAVKLTIDQEPVSVTGWKTLDGQLCAEVDETIRSALERKVELQEDTLLQFSPSGQEGSIPRRLVNTEKIDWKDVAIRFYRKGSEPTGQNETEYSTSRPVLDGIDKLCVQFLGEMTNKSAGLDEVSLPRSSFGLTDEKGNRLGEFSLSGDAMVTLTSVAVQPSLGVPRTEYCATVGRGASDAAERSLRFVPNTTIEKGQDFLPTWKDHPLQCGDTKCILEASPYDYEFFPDSLRRGGVDLGVLYGVTQNKGARVRFVPRLPLVELGVKAPKIVALGFSAGATVPLTVPGSPSVDEQTQEGMSTVPADTEGGVGLGAYAAICVKALASLVPALCGGYTAEVGAELIDGKSATSYKQHGVFVSVGVQWDPDAI